MAPNQFRWIALATIMVLSVALAPAQERAPAGQPREPAQPAPERVSREVARPAPPAMSADTQVAALPLEHADADAVAHSLRPLMGDSVALSVDARSNSLIIAAPAKGLFEKVRDLARQLDTMDASTTSARLPTSIAMPLRASEAGEVVARLMHLLPRLTNVRFTPDQEANVVWIVGDREEAQFVCNLARDMDTAAAEHAQQNQRELRFYNLAHADPVRLAETINRVLHAMDSDVSVVPDPASGMLVAYATAAESTQLQMLVQKLDVPPRDTGPGEPPHRDAAPREAPLHEAPPHEGLHSPHENAPPANAPRANPAHDNPRPAPPERPAKPAGPGPDARP